MTTYHVIVEADYETQASDPESIRRRLRRLLKDNAFDEKNFEFSISRAEKPVGINREDTEQETIIKEKLTPSSKRKSLTPADTQKKPEVPEAKDSLSKFKLSMSGKNAKTKKETH